MTSRSRKTAALPLNRRVATRTSVNSTFDTRYLWRWEKGVCMQIGFLRVEIK